VISPATSITPDLNPMDEMCPSPVARRLMMIRHSPGDSPLWSGCGTIEGLNSAAASTEYSLVKYAPINQRRSRETNPAIEVLADHVVVGLEHC
jgi:hypothetical protein